MSQPSHITRAGIRRLVALHPVGRRGELRDSILVRPVVLGSFALERAVALLRDYLFDPLARAITATDEEEQAWLASSLVLRPVAAGCAVPLTDDLAAVIVAPALVTGDRLSDEAFARRFRPRADDALAAAIATLEPPAALREIERLLAAPGPEEERLHLALLQAGRALAWADPSLEESPVARAIVDRLSSLLSRDSAKPLLAAAVDALGPLAARATPLGAELRDRAAALVRAAVARIEDPRPDPGKGFLAELESLERARAIPDQDYYLTLPDRQLADAAATLLGRAVPNAPAAFAALRRVVLDERKDASLLAPFLDGMVDGAAVGPVGALVEALLGERDAEVDVSALGIARRMPLDACAGLILARLDARSPTVRAAAAAAVAMLEPAVAIPALVERLGDASPDVAAAAAAALVDLGAPEAPRALADEGRAVPAVAAMVAPPSEELVTALAVELGERLAADEEIDADTPSVAALARLLTDGVAGRAAAAHLLGERRDLLPVVALALGVIGRDEAAPGLAPSPAVREPLARALEQIADEHEVDEGLALALLARHGCGDAEVEERVLEALARTEDAGTLLTALADLRIRTTAAADALVPFLDDEEHIGARLVAAAVAGVAAPVDHPLWSKVRALASAGTVGAAAAWSALVHRVRFG